MELMTRPKRKSKILLRIICTIMRDLVRLAFLDDERMEIAMDTPIMKMNQGKSRSAMVKPFQGV
jgi:hypothetical protein